MSDWWRDHSKVPAGTLTEADLAPRCRTCGGTKEEPVAVSVDWTPFYAPCSAAFHDTTGER